jgi:hypothetical protein
MTNAKASEYVVEMKKAAVDFLMLPRDFNFGIRVPKAWRVAVEAEWKKAQKQPGGERFRTLTDYVIDRLSPKD